LPDIGKLETYKIPQGLGVRVDDGFVEGMDIPIYYDPMIAKLVTHGKNREEAIERMIRAIDDYQITGIETTLAFGKFVMEHDAFKSGNFDTHFVKNFFKPEYLTKYNTEEAEIAALSIAKIFKESKKISNSTYSESTDSSNNWVKNRKN
jgi:acetyl/propionyl-CoA carboxylase alpha subunit